MLLNVKNPSYNPDFLKKIAAARRGIKKYHKALIELAKS